MTRIPGRLWDAFGQGDLEQSTHAELHEDARYRRDYQPHVLLRGVTADESIASAGHEPNGYFWEGVVQYLAPELAEQLELDSEAGMFAAEGEG